MAFRMAIDAVHGELARRGHPDAKPMYGFVFQAIGPNGSTAVELGRALGITKQAAGKTIDVLERLGYIERARDDADSRRKVVRLTPYGLDLLAQSAQIFDAVRRDWSERIGSQRLSQVEDGMRELTGQSTFPLDAPGWFGGG
jgi:DNA-binding MarR family transcriptional regulator